MTPLYRCDTCQKLHLFDFDALACEAQTSVSYPVGMVFGTPYRHGTQAIKEEVTAVGHLRQYTAWAVAHLEWVGFDKTQGFGDRLGGYGHRHKPCIPPFPYHKAPREVCPIPPDPLETGSEVYHQPFRELVTALLSIGVEITCWDGVKPVPLVEFLRSNSEWVAAYPEFK